MRRRRNASGAPISIPQRCDYFQFWIHDATQKHVHFNTTKVRLFPTIQVHLRAFYGYFNTTKVRLFPFQIRRPTQPAIRFQYHKGAIISLISSAELFRPTEFQYHKGAIISRYRQTCVATICAFQYHKGAIISSACCTSGASSSLISIPQRCDYFLKPRRRSDFAMLEFQYHKGAIISNPVEELLAEESAISIPQRCDYFNSST